MLLQNKVAIVYGAAGGIGGAVARAFASAGARVFVTGHNPEAVAAVAEDIGNSAEAAAVDALDEAAIDKHLDSVVKKAGRVDISFNAMGIPGSKVLGRSLAEVSVEQFILPITSYVTSYFLTARLAARRMVPNKSGVIMTVSALPARMGFAMNGGYGPAQAAKEALTRDLSLEFARQGLRVVCLRPHGIPETNTIRDAFEIKGKPAGMAWEQYASYLAGTTHPKRTIRLDEVANAATFAASDKASGLTGTILNLSMGSLDD